MRRSLSLSLSLSPHARCTASTHHRLELPRVVKRVGRSSLKARSFNRRFPYEAQPRARFNAVCTPTCLTLTLHKYIICSRSTWKPAREYPDPCDSPFRSLSAHHFVSLPATRHTSIGQWLDSQLHSRSKPSSLSIPRRFPCTRAGNLALPASPAPPDLPKALVLDYLRRPEHHGSK